MNLIKATDTDLLEAIIPTLVEARKRYKSSDFLNTFPWISTKWYKVHDLEFANIESLYVFWDGSAWGERVILPRTLKQGANDFRKIATDISNPNYSPYINIEHLTDIIKHRHNA